MITIPHRHRQTDRQLALAVLMTNELVGLWATSQLDPTSSVSPERCSILRLIFGICHTEQITDVLDSFSTFCSKSPSSLTELWTAVYLYTCHPTSPAGCIVDITVSIKTPIIKFWPTGCVIFQPHYRRQAGPSQSLPPICGAASFATSLQHCHSRFSAAS